MNKGVIISTVQEEISKRNYYPNSDPRSGALDRAVVSNSQLMEMRVSIGRISNEDGDESLIMMRLLSEVFAEKCGFACLDAYLSTLAALVQNAYQLSCKTNGLVSTYELINMHVRSLRDDINGSWLGFRFWQSL
ncbi:hypothetical protein J6590_026737 [Homalodisca vitripennis]|nr:hypothetical protein J6590_026737 [Homalodisca vitripennis]